MGKDMPAHWLPPVCSSEDGVRSRIRLNLIGHEDDDVELFRELGKLAKMYAELLLAFTQFSSTLVVAAEKVENAVDNQESILSSREQLCQGTQRLVLIFTVGGTMKDNVVIRSFCVDLEYVSIVKKHRSMNTYCRIFPQSE
jgi:hypothetical protein